MTVGLWRSFSNLSIPVATGAAIEANDWVVLDAGSPLTPKPEPDGYADELPIRFGECEIDENESVGRCSVGEWVLGLCSGGIGSCSWK